MPRQLLILLAIGPLAGGIQASELPEFTGSDACRGCHRDQFEAWQGSHHRQAMQPATDATVLGDFTDAEFNYAGVTTRFFRHEGRFMVRTDDATGALQDFAISHTFGVYPVQQYLVAFPDGRYQALGIAWDSRPADQGGQRWFHLYPGEAVDHEDELHWTGALQNWNFMCADCHSTNLQKNYRSASDRFETTWSEISVGCEACHGPGSNHVAWATRPAAERAGATGRGLAFLLDERAGVQWAMNAETGNARRSRPNAHRREIEVCASCHSRRGIIREGAAREASFLDHYLPALLTEGLYHADGQILDEVYVWGSFVQSRMHAAGVTCSDCHDPHSQQLRAPGDAVCAQCHLPATYATATHHHHPPSSAGARCVNCHMPETTYMVVDPRRDHSMRIPRPDHSLREGTPNACSRCHTEQPVQWAAERFAAWYPQARALYQAWGPVFSRARAGDATAGRDLAGLVTAPEIPAIVRATAVLELRAYLDQTTAPALQSAARDPSPLVRMAAARAMDVLPVESALPFSAHLLQDDYLAVRSQAARLLAGAPRAQMNPAGADLLARAMAEYAATQELNADRAESLLNLGILQASLGEGVQAERYYRQALKRNPAFVPAYINLADLYRTQGMNAQAIATLQGALGSLPDTAPLEHALGLALVRGGRLPEALTALQRAAALEPENPRYAYVYAVALHSSGRAEAAVATLEGAHRDHPGDRDILFALAAFNRDLGRTEAALGWANRLLALDPADGRALQLRQSLEGPVK